MQESESGYAMTVNLTQAETIIMILVTSATYQFVAQEIL